MIEKKLVLLFITVTLIGCENRYIVDSPAIHITNMTGRVVHVKTKECNKISYVDKPVVIPSSSTYTIPVSRPCIDALATNKEGKVLGTQAKLRIPPNVKWSIY
ncbi:MAG: hypothetical protein KAT04_03795 [Methylococcales bacterium]|nr:hypothetical protein [Methylococcales bacterium]